MSPMESRPDDLVPPAMHKPAIQCAAAEVDPYLR